MITEQIESIKEQIALRKHKYRAFTKKWGMVYEDDPCKFIDVYNITVWCDTIDDEEIVLMQFTGLIDKNGKEIYEGDIVSLVKKDKVDDKSGDTKAITAIKEIMKDHPKEYASVVRFSGSSFGADIIGGLFADRMFRDLETVLHYYEAEKVGTIFENPELLTKDE